MTDAALPSTSRHHLKAARARRLTDPLGARGFRQTGARIRRERHARLTLFAVAVASFLGILGAVSGSVEPAPRAVVESPRVVWAIDAAGQVQAVQVVDAQPVTHVRTRSS